MDLPLLPALTLAASLVIAGCATSIEDYETTPVQLKTSKGVVTCQLYSHDRVMLDRAIDIPRTMTIKEGDALCKAEGVRILKGG